MNRDTYYPASTLPPKNEKESYDGYFESIRVLAFTERWLAAYVTAYYDEDEQPNYIWYSGCSESWNLDDRVKCWTYLPPDPI